MDRYVKINYVYNGELHTIRHKVESVKEALEEIGQAMEQLYEGCTITEFAFYYVYGEKDESRY